MKCMHTWALSSPIRAMLPLTSRIARRSTRSRIDTSWGCWKKRLSGGTPDDPVDLVARRVEPRRGLVAGDLQLTGELLGVEERGLLEP